MPEEKTKTKAIVNEQVDDDEFVFTLEEQKKEAPTPPVEKNNSRVVQKTKIKLEEVNYKARSTRSELYNELQAKEKKLDEDVYEYGNPILRGIALIIDVLFYAGIAHVITKIIPTFEMMIWDSFLNKYNLALSIPREGAIAFIILINIVVSLYLFIAIPVAFFNRTLGKKLTRLHVRGLDQYTIKVNHAFMREVIWKPISLCLLVGLVMPFFNKHKQSLHDRISNTIVTKE